MVDRFKVLARLLLPIGWLALAGLGVAACVHLLDLRTWPFELLHHFAPQYAIAALSICIVFAGLKHSLGSTAAILLALFFGAVHTDAPQPLEKGTLAPFGAAPALDFEGINARTRRLTVITYNLKVGNRQYRQVYTWLAGQPADVVVLQEVSKSMAATLGDLHNIYPHQILPFDDGSPRLQPHGRLGGLAIPSRYSILHHETLKPAGGTEPALIAQLSVTGTVDPWLITVHPWIPLVAGKLAERDRYLDVIADAITRLEGPVIVAGDFNATPYAPVFRSFLKKARMTTFTRFPATFPARMGPFGISIDHILVGGIRLAHLKALPSIGSDHRPLQALLFLPAMDDEPTSPPL